jgi:transcriptional regulator with XRE-family HTH domain
MSRLKYRGTVGEAGGYVATVGERLKEERLLRGWSQRDLARESGTTAETISSIETGQHEPRPSTLRKLAKGLGIKVRDFYAEPALPKADAPRGAGQRSRAERLQLMREYEGTVLDVYYKYSGEAERLVLEAEEDHRNLDRLMVLYVQIMWTYDGAVGFAEEDETLEEAQRGSAEEREAWRKVNEAIESLYDIAEVVDTSIQSLGEPAEQEVTYLETHRRRKRAG